jgi:O-antigen/teichoic acid export membrane protein
MTRDVSKLLRISFAIALLCSIMLFFAVPYLITFIYGSQFAPSIQVVQLILPGILFIIIFKVLNGHLSGIGKPYISALVFAPPVVINIILNFYWIPLYGGLGAAMATNVSYTLGAIALLIVYSRVMKISLGEMLHYRLSDFDFIRNLKTKLLRS